MARKPSPAPAAPPTPAATPLETAIDGAALSRGASDAHSASARVLEPFDGVPDGEVHPRPFHPGDEIEGDLARAMIAAGKAEAL